MYDPNRAERSGSVSLPKCPEGLSSWIKDCSLPALKRRCSELVAGLKDLNLPEHPLSDKESGGLYAIRSAQKDILSGAHRAAPLAATEAAHAASAAGPVAGRLRLALNAARATGGGRLISGLVGGATRIGGRLIAPVIFGLDVFSEQEKSRGLAKATGGLVGAGLGWSVGSALGTGIGTLLLPGIGTTAGYFAGGALGAVFAYGYGKLAGMRAYDWVETNHPELVEEGKRLGAAALAKGKETGSKAYAYLRTHVPQWIAGLRKQLES